MAFADRAAIFLKAADLLAGPWRDTINAATMLGQSKNAYQAEIDAACELIDFFRFNVQFAQRLYAEQPISSPGIWNRLEYRPLEGFVLAVTPFNFTAIQANLPAAPALMGNVVLWKPSTTALFSAHYLMALLEAAGLPPGVINLLPGDGPDVGGPALADRDFAGLHFTGSTGTFNRLQHEIAGKLGHYRGYPRIVGETGGKDFILMHPSAEALPVAVALVRGAFEYQGQKCSAASRVYLPASQRDAVLGARRGNAGTDHGGTRRGVQALCERGHRRALVRPDRGLHRAGEKRAATRAVLFGGGHSKETGYFVDPTVIEATAPGYESLCEEIFGPVVSVYTYDDARWHDTLKLVDRTGPYALTGSVFATDRRVIAEAADALRDAAGNFYINDKPTGAVVGQQPFGGARASGTNDKAGSLWNLVRWVSPRAIKETFVPPVDFTYPFLGPEEGAI